MKWIKLFEEYNHEDKIESTNLIWLVFDYKKRFQMEKIEDSKGNIFYYELSPLTTLQSGTTFKPELRILLTHDKQAYIDFSFLLGDLIKSFEKDFDPNKLTELTDQAVKIVLNCKSIKTFGFLSGVTNYQRRLLELLSGEG